MFHEIGWFRSERGGVLNYIIKLSLCISCYHHPVRVAGDRVVTTIWN